MKLTINAVHFEAAERLKKYIAKKTTKYAKMLNDDAEIEVRLSVVKPETNLNKQTQIRILGEGTDLFAVKVCDSFEQGVDACLDALDKQVEKTKQR